MGVASQPQVVGRYEIYGKIASGGMATVHFGRLLGGAGFARTVAVKRLHPHLAEDPEFLATMIDEARLAARIHHPNVVSILDVVSTEGELLLVMEYVRGESLANALRGQAARGERVPLPIASAIVVGALYGLHAAHEATSDQGEPLGIVHRDVSPQNILVGVDGLARVIDFGIAKAAGRIQTTREGTVKGKLAYMAPEQLAAREVTRTADVYAMGVILWEILTGTRLFVGETDGAVLSAVVTGAKYPPSRHVPDLPPALDAITMKALAPESADRFATAREMAEGLASRVSPALPADVGAWCSNVARDSLAKWSAVVAEFESSASGKVSTPQKVFTPAPEVSAERARAIADMPTPLVNPARPPAPAAADDADTILSQPSSLAIESPGAVALRPRRRTLVAAMVAGAAAFTAVLGLVFASRTRPAIVADPSASASALPGAGSAATQPPPAELETTPAAPQPSIVPSAKTVTAAPAPSPATQPRTGSARVRYSSGPPAADPCNPPYVFDADGHKKWKRQCF